MDWNGTVQHNCCVQSTDTTVYMHIGITIPERPSGVALRSVAQLHNSPDAQPMGVLCGVRWIYALYAGLCTRDILSFVPFVFRPHLGTANRWLIGVIITLGAEVS